MTQSLQWGFKVTAGWIVGLHIRLGPTLECDFFCESQSWNATMRCVHFSELMVRFCYYWSCFASWETTVNPLVGAYTNVTCGCVNALKWLKVHGDKWLHSVQLSKVSNKWRFRICRSTIWNIKCYNVYHNIFIKYRKCTLLWNYFSRQTYTFHFETFNIYT